jgi:CheY-like chemotaxis protein/anti-sigma regulatory factor (Ser/Thr protein kinase)
MQHALATIERNAKAQTQLIEDLLDVSRIVTGKLRLDVRPVELAGVLEAALDSVRPGAEARGLSVEAELPPESAVVAGDPDRLQQVVWNLLSNAIKFTARGGRVALRLVRNEGHAEIRVEDSGIGIAPEFLPHVFARFSQADPSSTRQHQGLGLGLAIVRHLVELHGGTVRAESEGAGRGASFVVRLPLLDAAPAGRRSGVRAVAAHSSVFTSPDLEGVRVLVVDDDPDALDLLSTLLRQKGAVVLSATRADEAVELLRNERPQVLVSDIEMPGEDGYAFIRRVRALRAEEGGRTPAAALTAYARTQDRLRALLAGYQIHLPKPVDPAELASVVASLVERTPRA